MGSMDFLNLVRGKFGGLFFFWRAFLFLFCFPCQLVRQCPIFVSLANLSVCPHLLVAGNILQLLLGQLEVITEVIHLVVQNLVLDVLPSTPHRLLFGSMTA